MERQLESWREDINRNIGRKIYKSMDTDRNRELEKLRECVCE